jgi:hypothetical protein
MNAVVSLFERETEPSFLCSIRLYRRPDGSIKAAVWEMDGDLVETTGDNVASRLSIIADWAAQGAADLSSQAQTFVEPPNER